MLSVVSTVIWAVFAAAGTIGLRFTDERSSTIRKTPPHITVERVNVNMMKSEQRAVPIAVVKPRMPLPEPHMPDAMSLPPLAAVADPRLNIPFAVAVKGPARTLEASKAVPTQGQPNPDGKLTPAVDHLTFGAGEGDQPAPEYPREAKLAHQEGSVVVQMTIGENGDVTNARVSSACPFPILNQAALRAVRDTWHFGTGPIRYKDIEFVFELHQR